MRRWLAAGICAMVSLAAVPAVPAAEASPSTTVTVAPRTGGVHTRFALRFTIPAATGPLSGLDRSDAINISGLGRPWCTGDQEMTLPAAAANHTFNIAVGPGWHQRWCAGVYQGTLVERQTTECGPPLNSTAPVMCPQIMFAPVVISRFGFRVER